MSHGPEHQVEHAEHAVHATHDEFNRRVTMSIAIVAAVLACVSMLGHRAHNETLRLQGEALRFQGEALALRTEASIKSTEAANKWAYYQSKNQSNLLSEIVVDLLDCQPIAIGRGDKLEEVRKRYEENIAYYTGNKDNRSTRRDKGEDKKKPEGKLAKEKEHAEKLKEEAEETIRKAEEKIKKVEETIELSHVEHDRSARFDYGELGLQFGVVLCSLAILTRGRGFWFGGIISSAIGALFGLTGQLGLFLGGH